MLTQESQLFRQVKLHLAPFRLDLCWRVGKREKLRKKSTRSSPPSDSSLDLLASTSTTLQDEWQHAGTSTQGIPYAIPSSATSSVPPSSTLTRPSPPSLRATSAENKRVIDWLRNKSGIKVKTGALAGKRHDYFKGTSPLSLSLLLS